MVNSHNQFHLEIWNLALWGQVKNFQTLTPSLKGLGMKRFVRRLKLDKVRDDINSFILKRQVHNTNFTIIANNCWGSRIYQELGFKYNTPFVGLFFVAPCYIRLLGNLDYYLASDLQFVNQSKYRIFQKTKDYPIGLIGKDVEIHFRHHQDAELCGVVPHPRDLRAWRLG